MQQHPEGHQDTFKRSLLVGATGMLGQAARWVADRSQTSFLVARRASEAGELLAPTLVIPLDLDYRHKTDFLRGLEEAGALAEIDLAVLWIHETGAEAERALVDSLASNRGLIVTVRGSQHLSDLAGTSSDKPDDARRVSRCITVTLGAKTEGGQRRWLTWEEISDGVIDAIRAGDDRIVGDLDHRANAHE